ncbi:hypothetical protein L873DRAFT_1758267 [Choiromyces venosus 120613-1]|uniref:Uncharacterized protein n=1 Tax=Choiromyces venosus 120613-1 TaxID=1336337 RepID=A0A3N4K781_9PEZI|nr:hypothetical protein L873DRAFT_1758267 [Choiromyces venosus 120613-1]
MGVSQAEASCQTGVPCPTVNLWSKTCCSWCNHTCSGHPTENVWKILKQRIKAQAVFPGTIESVAKAIKEEWDKLALKNTFSMGQVQSTK